MGGVRARFAEGDAGSCAVTSEQKIVRTKRRVHQREILMADVLPELCVEKKTSGRKERKRRKNADGFPRLVSWS
jgi:hypothetical protein